MGGAPAQALAAKLHCRTTARDADMHVLIEALDLKTVDAALALYRQCYPQEEPGPPVLEAMTRSIKQRKSSVPNAPPASSTRRGRGTEARDAPRNLRRAEGRVHR